MNKPMMISTLSEAERQRSIAIYQAIQRKHNAVTITAGSIVGAVLSGALLAWIMVKAPSNAALAMIVTPGFIIGGMSRLTCGAFCNKLCLIPAVFGMALITSVVFLLGGSIAMYLLAIPNAVIAASVTKKRLSTEERLAIYRVKQGLIDRQSTP
ncbi:hypothetical protein [Marinibactrum halimedae]|uniref:hypothetical protein n=1 Tax=Marinibactrum halimedae TaxID=1444977 RepID=UPI001E51FA42|nr:hypothetical protein [Marinibactrum halimedae]MCD9457738.1 hypothetical protein [Marinibactrum halimedae]